MPASLAHRRLVAQHVAKPALAGPRAVVEHLGALQAQDFAASLWAIGLRMRRPSLARVQRAIERGEILRTWPMRGTLHFVAAQDARWMVALLAPRALRKAASRERDLGITGATLAKARRALTRALEGGHALTRAEAYAALERAGVATGGYRGIHVLGHLAQEGTLCIGPHEGKQATFVLLDEAAPRGEDGTLPGLAARYAMSHGPAAVGDFAWWAGIGKREALEALRAARGLREEEGLWSAAKPRTTRVSSPEAHLLPAFDESAVAYKDRSAALARVGAGVANAQIGLLSPCIVVDGQMVGTWGRSFSKDRVQIALKPIARWTRGEREAIERAAQRYARFLGRAPAIEVRALAQDLPGRLATRA